MPDATNFTVDTDASGIALVTWDMPGRSMNVFTESVLDELEAIRARLAGDAGIKGVVITSGKKDFSGGADLGMLQKMMALFEAERAGNPEGAVQALFDNAGRMSALFRRIETCGKPWVAAISGTAMGGAFEMALACHGRVVSNAEATKLALPEVKVGIFPGAGGTQRVARLADTQAALEMLTSGKTLSPAKAKSMNLVHAVVAPDELIETAKKMIRDGLKPVAPWDEKGFKLPGGPVYSAAGASLWPPAAAILKRETFGNYPAAAAILKAVYEGLLLPIDLALKVELRWFTHILQTREAAAMVRSLFVSLGELNKGARRPREFQPTTFSRIGVLGAGFMGAGIAYVTAKAGIPVVLVDRDQTSADKGKAHSETLVSAEIKKGRAKPEDRDRLLELITPTDDPGALAGCDLVIEAVFEDSAVKAEAITKAEAVLSETAVFASNTSTIPITALAKNAIRPESFIGLHFFSPVDKMLLVEIIIGEETGDRALSIAFDYVRAIRKTPIVVNDTRGFFVNRCVLRYMAEAYDMLIEGVPAAMIENAAKMAGMPVGPLALTDETAIDLAQKIMHQTVRDLGDKAVDKDQMRLIDRMVGENGRLGRKNGKGFYDYPPKPTKKKLWPGLKGLYPQLAPEKIDGDELKSRFLVTVALEAARAFEEGIVSDPREADVGSILAFGFAPYSGGALSFIDGMGTDKFVKLAAKLEKKFGKQFKPPKLLVEMAARGETFYGRFTAPRGGPALAAA